jgi:hypothetical protein
MKKTDRKNKTNLTVNWPKNIFTIEELNQTNPDFVNITLRVRLKKAIADNAVAEVGYLHNGKGRPRLVLACAPITQEHIAEAKSKGVVLKDGLSVNVLTVNASKEESVATVIESTKSQNVTMSV